jgi:hypothetical protein
MKLKSVTYLVLVPALAACNSVLGNDQADLFADAAPSDATVGPLQPPGPEGCDAGTKTCNGLCVSDDDPLYGCRDTSCSPCEIPHATAACASGRCVIQSCGAGYADCNQDPTDGCETDVSTAQHCGSCKSACSAAAPDCAPANGGFACTDNCPANAPVLCGTQCVDLSSSISHCGSCSVRCPSVMNGSAVCAGGTCSLTCNADFHACGAGCASDSDPATCGASCTPCVPPPNGAATCNGIQCGFMCNGGYHACGGVCASNTDPATCGALCTPCPSGPNSTATCNGTACGFTCAPGFADCSGNAAAGCTVNLMIDPANCGACARACPPGQPCVGGVCAGPPPVDAGVDSGPITDAGAGG